MGFNTTGIFYSSFNPDQLNARSFAATILRLFPNGTAPLFGFTSQLPKTRAKKTEHGYFTKSMAFATLTLDDADDMADSDTTMVVDSSAGVVVGMVFQVPTTRELIRVTAVDSATQVTISRSFGRVAAGAIVDDEVCFCVGNAHTQASNRPTARTIGVTYVPNYTQIVRNAWAISDTARAEYAEAGFNNIAENRSDCMLMHGTDIEAILFWGQAQEPSGSPPIHSTQGLIDAIYQYASDNVKTAAGTTTYAQLVAMIEPVFAQSTDMGDSRTRLGFCDAQANRVLNDIGRTSGQIQITQEETTFGTMFNRVKTYKGDIILLEHPMFNGMSITAGLLVLVELASLRVAYLDGRDVRKEEYGGGKNQDSGIDADGGSLTSEFATEFKNPGACGVINGLTAAA